MHNLFLCILLVASCSLAGAKPPSIRAPCVFHADDVEMHKYAAVLAATEPFKMQCNDQIKDAMGPFKYMLSKLKGQPLLNQAIPLRNNNERIDAALLRYEMRVENTLRAYGMSTDSFNTISKTVSNSPTVKRKIALQAYYYKIAADLEQNLRPALPMLPSNLKDASKTDLAAAAAAEEEEKSGASGGQQQGQYSVEMMSASPLHKFSRSLRSIERKRLLMRSNLKAELGLTRLPPNMCDPDLRDAMCPEIRQACVEFPIEAQQVLSRNHLKTEDFNSMQRKMRRNIFFRILVQQELRKMDKQRQTDSSGSGTATSV